MGLDDTVQFLGWVPMAAHTILPSNRHLSADIAMGGHVHGDPGSNVRGKTCHRYRRGVKTAAIVLSARGRLYCSARRCGCHRQPHGNIDRLSSSLRRELGENARNAFQSAYTVGSHGASL